MFCWISVSLHGASTSPGAGGLPGLHFVLVTPPNSSSVIHEPKSSGFPRSQVEFHRDFSSRNPGMLLLALGSAWSPRSAARPPPLLPGTAVGCSWSREAGMQQAGNVEGVGSCAHAGSRRSLLSSLLCPRSCSVWDSPSTSADLEFSRWDRGGEGRGKRGKLFLLGCFPSRRVKNPAQAQPG